MKVGTEKWPKVGYGKPFSCLHMKHCCCLIHLYTSVVSLCSFRRWHLTLALNFSSSSTLIAVITSGVTSSLWQPWASQISLFLGCRTCSCWWLAWWVALLPEPLPWNPLRVRLFSKISIKWNCFWIILCSILYYTISIFQTLDDRYKCCLFQRYALLRSFHQGKCPMFSLLLYGNPFCDTGCVKQGRQIRLKCPQTRYSIVKST